MRYFHDIFTKIAQFIEPSKVVIIPYKPIKFLNVEFKIANKGNWIKFSDKEILSFLKAVKISKDTLLKSHDIDQIKESKEIVRKIKITALNRIEILGYIADTDTDLKAVKSIKDITKLREKFVQLVKSDKKLEATVKENDDIDRYSIIGEFTEIEIKEVRDNSPVFNFKRLLKFYLESEQSKNPVVLNWTINKSKK